jgi:hypothetical protein
MADSIPSTSVPDAVSMRTSTSPDILWNTFCTRSTFWTRSAEMTRAWRLSSPLLISSLPSLTR